MSKAQIICLLFSYIATFAFSPTVRNVSEEDGKVIVAWVFVAAITALILGAFT
jgi:hypothetical protein